MLGVKSLSPEVEWHHRNGTIRMASLEWQCNPCYSERFIILICITDIKDLGENRTSLTTSHKPCGLKNM